MVPVTIPALGETILQVRILRWFKKVGERVVAGEPLVEISTDKIDAVLECPADGVLAEATAAPEEYVDVGATVASVDDSAVPG